MAHFPPSVHQRGEPSRTTARWSESHRSPSTFAQEFFGGADIIMESAQNGQLKEALEVAYME